MARASDQVGHMPCGRGEDGRDGRVGGVRSGRSEEGEDSLLDGVRQDGCV